MKKFLLTATAVAALSVISTSALAVNLDPPCSGTPTFATELVFNNAQPSSAVLNGAGLVVTHQLGIGIAVNELRWFRYNLTNGVFGVAVGPAEFSDPGASSQTLLAGGQVGDNFVIIARGAASVSLLPTAIVTMNLDGKVKVLNKNSPVGVAVAIYDDASGASLQQAANRFPSSVKSCDLAKFASGLTFAATTNTTTANVAALPNGPYTSFLDGVAGPTFPRLAKIGEITHEATAGVLDPTDGLQVILPDLLAAGTRFIVTTDSNWLPADGAGGSVFLSGPGNDCNADIPPAFATPPGATLIGNSASRTVGSSAASGLAVCYRTETNNMVPIEVQRFVIELDAVAVAGVNPVPNLDRGPVDLGFFIRNGTILKHSFAEAAGGSTGYLHAVHLTNTTSSQAPFTVRCLKPTGFDVGVPDTLGASSARRYGLTSMCSATPAAQLRGIELTFAVPNGSVFGAMVRQNTTTGEASFDTMIGSQIGSK